jgi:hypothetical protein
MKYFIAFLASIALIIFVIVLIVRGFTGNHKKQDLPTPLIDYANTSVQMQYTLAGPVTADEERVSLRITVGQDQTKIEKLVGYNETIALQKSYANNLASYSEFLRALDIAGYSLGNTDPSLKDERGYCPSGQRYSFDIVDGGSVKQHFWTTSCGKSGNFKGKPRQVITLFQDQVPDYGKDGFTLR